MIRLIAIDMDGTLLNPNLVVSERNKQAILQVQASGIEVVIATGRGFIEARDPVMQAQLDLSYICLNGADVRDQEGNVLSSTYLLEKDVPLITSILKHEGIDQQIFIGNHVYTKSAEEFVDLYTQIMSEDGQIPPLDKIRSEVYKQVEQGYIQVVDTFDHIFNQSGDKVYKIFGSSLNRASLDSARLALTKVAGISVSSSGAGNLEITNINAQKGIALEQYANNKGISMEQVMAIGDSYNDLSMMKKAKVSVAMGSAPDEIKQACTKVTESNENDGVAQAIEELLKVSCLKTIIS